MSDLHAVLPTSLSRSSRRLVILGVILVVAIGGTVGWLISTQRAVALTEYHQATNNIAQVLAEQTSRSMQPIDLALREILAQFTANGTLTPDAIALSLGSKATYDLLVDDLKGLAHTDALLVADAGGRMLNFSRGFPPPPLDVSGRDYYQHLSTHDDHALFVSAPARGYASGVWSIWLARRINGAHGEFAGVVAAVITLSDLEGFYKAVTPGPGTVTLLRRDGIVLVHYPQDEREIGWKLPVGAPWYQLLDEQGGSFRSPGYMNHVARLVSVRPLRDFPLVINVSTSESAALSNWHWQMLWLLTSAVIAAACAILLLVIFGRQFSRLTLQNAALDLGRLQLDAAIGNMSQGLTFFDRDQKLIVSNRRYRIIYQLSPDEMRVGMSFSDILDHRMARGTFLDMTRADYVIRHEAHFLATEPNDIADELIDGRTIAIHYQPLPDGGWVSTHEDITERRRTEATLVFTARHDSLTQLPNRVLFQERLVQAIELTRFGTGCALLYLDLDSFKAVNDTLGHPAGDELLRAVAARLLDSVREDDTVARLGGDEFAVVQVGIRSAEQTAVLADRIIRLIHQPYDIEGHRVVAGISIGVAIAPSDGTSTETLMKNADTALYLAKMEGRGTYRFFKPEMDARIARIPGH